ncbi:MAG: ABC transporter permease [Nisaea sp.]|jgi:putative hydroxymethylpyrimidine transport system permease protein|nr:ABC transporter permease [Rhodospirillaceae bacterium]MCH2630804.1 ABC transporter permease [Nisaea sp.]MEC7807095.1 ABC transporter permease [Pseudomonadota bacterium]MEC7974030.1 ABC transporter permease [Pseudomonadota bacterium]MEC9099636.1 ABC transporter permease [Pseudomonadota bacterium]|tara:strand:+ start:1583 stop:2323 length:741 start_codon:yes stop_codon:yes gene_type:complete
MRILFRFVVVTSCLLLFWHFLVIFANLPKFILPSPMLVMETFISNFSLIFKHAIVTGSEILLGLLAGTVLGSFTAICLAISPLARTIVRPMMVLSQALPVFALAPLLTLWLGYGLWPKILMALLIIYFPVTSAFFDGLMNTPKGMLDLSRVMNGTSWRIMLNLRIPAAVPGLASGLRLAAVYAPIGAIIGEWVGASEGLGYLMLLANGRAKIDLMFAALIVLVVMTLILHWSIDRLGNSLTARMSP